MAANWTQTLARWTAAGLLDEETAARIRAFEQGRAGQARLRWPILAALAFGALLVAAGVLLFVSAHWDTLSPSARFALALLLVAAFHVAGALTADRFPGMATALHAVGTVSLGAGIFLAGQIFNLQEHWPGGVMWWALGAAAAAALLRQLPQVGLVSVLAPAWLASEWFVATRQLQDPASAPVLGCGLLLLALAYFASPVTHRIDPMRRMLLWIGGVCLLPSAFLLAVSAAEGGRTATAFSMSTGLRIVGWTAALGVPLAIGYAFRRQAVWPLALAALWAVVLVNLNGAAGSVPSYGWWALGGMGLMAWGVGDGRGERINMGATIFTATVITFYFSEVMDKLERSASLAGLGLLFLAGGWALERVRRRLIAQARGPL